MAFFHGYAREEKTSFKVGVSVLGLVCVVVCEKGLVVSQIFSDFLELFPSASSARGLFRVVIGQRLKILLLLSW